MWRQICLSPAEDEKWKVHGLPLEEGKMFSVFGTVTGKMCLFLLVMNIP